MTVVKDCGNAAGCGKETRELRVGIASESIHADKIEEQQQHDKETETRREGSCRKYTLQW